jgi:CheY-like chemotaxis protein
MKILVVDDNATNRLLAAMMLEDRGWTIAEARDGAEALAAVRREKYDVILLDISMPGMGGDEVCRHIKADMPGPRVVAFTAHVMPDEVGSIMSAGFDGLLTKPFTQDQLIASLWAS